MENINIEEIIINNFYKLVEHDKLGQRELQKHIDQIKKGLELIEKNNQLEVLKLIYIVAQNLHENLNNANKRILIIYSNIFEEVTTGIFFALNYQQECCQFRINKDEDTYTILEVPQEFKEKVNEVMDKTYKDWKDIIRIKTISY